MGSVSIDLSLANVWRSWEKFRQGKTLTKELDYFNYYLEKNLYQLYTEINNGRYQHGGYQHFIITDNKRRQISVAGIRDRVVHRLLYEYLVNICDQTFIFDAWSCRAGKGLAGAIERTQKFLHIHPYSLVWRADIKKFFNSIDHKILLKLIGLKVRDTKALWLLGEVVSSYSTSAKITAKPRSKLSRAKGMSIGNLTSQIFANIYLNELDRTVKHRLKPKAYLRYGDDFIIIEKNPRQLQFNRKKIIDFIKNNLLLEINIKNDIIVKTGRGLHFLGCEIFPQGRRLNKRNWTRINTKCNLSNFSSYSGLLRQHSNEKKIIQHNWQALIKLNI